MCTTTLIPTSQVRIRLSLKHQFDLHLLPFFSSVAVAWIDNVGFCNYSLNTSTRFKVYFGIPRYVLGMVLLVLALTKHLSQSVAMYKATKQWQPNRYMKLFMQDGILYFFL